MIKHVVVVLLLFIVNSCVFADTNEYISPTFGFRITKPESWQFATAQQSLDNLRNMKLKDPEFQQMMLKRASAPLVIICKYPDPYEDVNPSIKVSVKPLGPFKGLDAKLIVNLMLPSFQNAFKDFVVEQDPLDVTISGFKGAYVRYSYFLENIDSESFRISSEVWIIPQSDYFFIIGSGLRADEKTGSRQEVRDILSTIHIE